MEDRTGTKVGCVEEIAWRNGWITSEQLLKLAGPLLKSGYGDYLVALSKK
jgi:glucose-1-phosphate thymidylyltransferase